MILEQTFATQTATGATASIESMLGFSDDRRPAKDHTVQITATGTATTATGQLEGSVDNTQWAAISSARDVSSDVMFHVLNAPVKFIRFNLTALAGGSSPTITAKYLGSN